MKPTNKTSLGRRTKRVIYVYVACLCLGLTGPLPLLSAQPQPNVPAIGKVVAWGSNKHGQTNIPPELTNVIAIAAGSVHSLALRNDGTVCAWGSGAAGETNVPVGLSNVVAIAAAGFHANSYGYSLALKSDGTVTGWGVVSLPPYLNNVVAVAAGAYWWMALRSDGTITANYPSFASGPLTLGGTPISNVVAIASGGRHILALIRDGTVVGWGMNYHGQATGVPSGTLQYAEGVVTLGKQTLSNVVSIVAGNSHSAAQRLDGTVVVWGDGSYGQANVPMGLSNAATLAPGGNESANQVLVVKADGQLAAWGGNNAQTNVAAGLSNVVAAAVGSAHSLALIGAGPLNPHSLLFAPAWMTNSFSLSVPTQSGRVYSLEFTESLRDTDWTIASLTAGNGHLRTLAHPLATNSTSFYRVRQW